MKRVGRFRGSFPVARKVGWVLVLVGLFAAPILSHQSVESPNAGPPADSVASQVDALDHDDSGAGAMPRMIIDMTPGDIQLLPLSVERPGKLSRWINLRTASLSTRYNYIENSAQSVTNNQGQYQAAFKGAFLLGPDGRLSLEAGVFPGSRFSSGWSGTGWGTSELRTNLYLKQLYLSAKPICGLELQYGGLYFNQGVSTEITGYDYDGYLTGERARVTRPGSFFFDEISITYAYVGEFDQPSVLKRLHRLKQSNYHQFLVAKMIGPRILVSADYTSQSGIKTLREALRVHTKELRLIDVLHFENYQVAGSDSGYGFAAYGEKKIYSKVSVGGGFAQHDRAGLYSDRFAPGKRIFVNLQMELTPSFSISTSYTQAIRNSLETNPRTRLDVALNYDLLRTVRKTGIF